MSAYKILMSKDSHDYFNAMLKAQYQPSEENTKSLDKISERISSDLDAHQLKKEISFIEMNGTELLDFIKKISKPRFLVGKDAPFHLTWDIKSDENDNYWEVDFYKGVFSYRLSICGGYGGHETIEENITKERVLELLNIQL